MGTPAKWLNVSSVLIKKSLYTFVWSMQSPRLHRGQRSRGCRRVCGPEHPGVPSIHYRAAGIERSRAAAEPTDELGHSCGL